MRLEDFFRRLDDEGGSVFVEFVNVRLEPAVLGTAEVEGKGVVGLVGAEPDKTVRPHHQIGFEYAPVAVANFGIDTIRGDDEIGIRELEVGIDLAIEDQLDAELLAARLQDIEEPLAANADETVAGGAHAPAFDQDLDVVPVIEGAFN